MSSARHCPAQATQHVMGMPLCCEQTRMSVVPASSRTRPRRVQGNAIVTVAAHESSLASEYAVSGPKRLGPGSANQRLARATADARSVERVQRRLAMRVRPTKHGLGMRARPGHRWRAPSGSPARPRCAS